ncbi:unnamed protein product, partial [marine sediment metagenome]
MTYIQTKAKRIKNMIRWYGLGFEDYQQLYKNQQGLCPICLKPLGFLAKRTHVDH